MGGDYKKLAPEKLDAIVNAAQKKIEMMELNPYLLDFSVRAFYQDDPEVKERVDGMMQDQINNMIPDYFSKIDMTRFRPEISPVEILQMLVWMTDGYMHQRMTLRQSVDAAELVENFHRWMELLKKIAYKQEAQERN